MTTASKCLKGNKAPEPDGVPAKVLKLIAEELLKLYNTCIAQGVFSNQWKLERLTLINKGKENPQIIGETPPGQAGCGH